MNEEHGQPDNANKGKGKGNKGGADHRNAGRGFLNRMLDRVEKAGNRLPDPVTVFVIIIALVMIASLAGYLLGVGVVHPGTGEDIRAVNLFSGENFQRMFSEMPQRFDEFPPLGLVLVVML
ncbi:MAG: AbgT family transporter, partial [Balneolaceae bacterium]